MRWDGILKKIATSILDSYHLRCDRGICVDGRSMDRYTKKYEDYKKKRGRILYSEGDWLHLTGKLMKSVYVDIVDEKTVDIAFRDERGKGKTTNSQVAEHTDAKRPHLGTNDEEIERALDYAGLDIDQEMDKGLDGLM